MRRHRAVFFDFGGTLFSYRPMRRSTVRLIGEAVQRLGIDVDLGVAARAYGGASQRAFAEHLPRPYFLHRDVFHAAFGHFAAQFEREASRELLDWFHEAQRRQVLEEFRLREGARDVVSTLRSSGLHVGIVSNIDDDYLEPMLARCGLDALVDAWTSSEQAASCKPDPGIYRVALAKAGVDPADVLFVGDSREQDIAGARALGMETALIVEPDAPPPGAGALPAAEPHHTIAELGELLAIARPPA
jgi:HAD superfamily hydrolase (TIGR01509 family)